MPVNIGDSGQRRPFVQEHEWMPFFVVAPRCRISQSRSSDVPEARPMRPIPIIDLLSNVPAVVFSQAAKGHHDDNWQGHLA
jgi:hypothetical protein